MLREKVHYLDTETGVPLKIVGKERVSAKIILLETKDRNSNKKVVKWANTEEQFISVNKSSLAEKVCFCRKLDKRRHLRESTHEKRHNKRDICDIK